MRCPHCGAENPGSATFCQNCGVALGTVIGPQGQHVMPPMQTVPPPIRKSRAGPYIAVAAVAILAVVIGLVVAAVLFSGLTVSTAYMTVNLNSTHVSYDVSYNMYVNEDLKDSGIIPAGYSMQVTFDYSWGTDSPVWITISATSTGGGIGSESDSDSVMLEPGGTYTVNLYI